MAVDQGFQLKRYLCAAAFGIFLSTSVAAQSVQPRRRDSLHVRILATHDLHGALTAATYPWSQGRLIGGLPALDATMDSAAARCRCITFRVDGGDQMQGTLESNLVRGESVVRAFNLLGLDAAAVGNHELDWGIDTLKLRQREARYPWLAANVFLRGSRTRPDWARPFAIVERGGARIGVVGYATVITPTTQKTALVAPFEFVPGVAGIADAIDSVRRRSPDFIVIVAHAGGACTNDRCTGEMVDLANQLDSAGVDLIVGGHSHTAGVGVVHGIPIVRASSHGRAVSVIDLVRTANGQHRFSLNRDTVFVDRVTPSRDMTALLAPYASRVDSIARVPRAMLRDTAFERAQLGPAVAAAIRETSRADVAMMNPGGVRADLPAGTVTFRDLFLALPFDNMVSRVKVSGRLLREVVEHTLGDGIYYFAGLRIRHDRSKPRGQRLVSMTFADGRPIADDAAIVLGVPDFLAGGGEGLDMLAPLPAEHLGVTVLEALAAWIERLPRPAVIPRDTSVSSVSPP